MENQTITLLKLEIRHLLGVEAEVVKFLILVGDEPLDELSRRKIKSIGDDYIQENKNSWSMQGLLEIIDDYLAKLNLIRLNYVMEYVGLNK